MKIYTKTGDKGETGLMGGKRLKKDSLRIHAIGEIDEINANLGLLRAQKRPRPQLDNMLRRLQNELFDLGADLATPLDSKVKVPRVTAKQVANLEKWIDGIDKELAPLRNFILPGGSSLAAQLHVARAVCRRAERTIVALQGREKIGENVVKYVNRLSDLLFVMARYANKMGKFDEEKWGKRL